MKEPPLIGNIVNYQLLEQVSVTKNSLWSHFERGAMSGKEQGLQTRQDRGHMCLMMKPYDLWLQNLGA